MAKKKQPTALAKYTRLRRQAKKKGIVVPRGTKLDELEKLVTGKTTTKAVRTSARKRKTTKKKTTRKRASSSRQRFKDWGW